MFVSGFTIIRNGVKFDYPVVEAISSILPLCDEFVVLIGDSDDTTVELIQSINSPKIKIEHSVWDENLREGGRVLAEETNKSLALISPKADWAFYIQSDEVFHEADLPKIRNAMQEYIENDAVQCLVFEHINFWGSYDFIADSHGWVKREVRVFKANQSIQSWKDAMGFRKDGALLRGKLVDATIYHYGWVKHPKDQVEKRKDFEKLWHDDEWVDKNVSHIEEWDYSQIDSLAPFEDAHPAVMRERIERQNWDFKFDQSQVNITTKEKLLRAIRKTGWRAGEFKNYKLI